MKTLYITDLDGTLLNTNAELSDFSKNTINELSKKGMLISLATARSISSARFILDGVNLNVPAVMMNGVFLTDVSTHKAVRTNYISNTIAKKVVDVFKECGSPPHLYYYDGELDSEHTIVKSDYEKSYIDERKKRYRKFDLVSEYTLGDNVVYINIIDYPNKTMEIAKRLEEYDSISFAHYPDIYSGEIYSFLECYSANAGKWNGIKELCREYGCERVVAFGDNLNDLEMICEADLGVAVSNAHPQLLEIADLVIGSNDEDAVARFLLSEFEMGNFR